MPGGLLRRRSYWFLKLQDRRLSKIGSPNHRRPFFCVWICVINTRFKALSSMVADEQFPKLSIPLTAKWSYLQNYLALSSNG